MIKFLGIPFDFGQSHQGVRLTPDFFRQHSLLSFLQTMKPLEDLGNLDFSKFLEDPDRLSKASFYIQDFISKLELEKSTLLSVGGDHGLSLGTIHGLLKLNRNRVIVWVDAHGDINTPESSQSGNFHGMPLSYLLGIEKAHFPWMTETLPATKLIYFGPRDLDHFESTLIRDLSIQCYSSDEIDTFGIKHLLPVALKKADPTGKSLVHLSLDVDVFDEKDFKATGLSLSKGPRSEEILFLCEALKKTNRLASIDLVEFNPELIASSDYRSTQLMFNLLESLFS